VIHPGVQVLLLVGDMLASKMGGVNTPVPHRALCIAVDSASAESLVDQYNALPDEQKPMVRPNQPMVVKAYYALNDLGKDRYGAADFDKLMNARLNDFEQPTADVDRPVGDGIGPIHCLIQCKKLGEGYDEPKISVTGICYQIGGRPKNKEPNNGLSTFAQFTGRAVRKIASGDGFITAGISVNEKRDNIAHVVSHEAFNQDRHWPKFARQQGIGQEVPAGDDEQDDAASSVWSAHDDIPLATLARNLTASIGQQAPVQQRTDARRVKRFVLARDQRREDALWTQESHNHDGKLAIRWTVEKGNTF